jgi:hypothetical protein
MEQEFDSLSRERRVPSEAAIEAAARLRWARTESDSSPTRQWADAPAWIQKSFRETAELELRAAYAVDGVHAPDCSAVIFAPGAKGQGWEPACDCGRAVDGALPSEPPPEDDELEAIAALLTGALSQVGDWKVRARYVAERGLRIQRLGALPSEPPPEQHDCVYKREARKATEDYIKASRERFEAQDALKAARDALKPFAHAADFYDGNGTILRASDDERLRFQHQPVLTVADLRRARAVDGVGGGGDVPPNEPYASQARTRESAEAETRRRGFEPGELQYLWRTPECFARTYDMGEVGAAICDALTREGCTAWWGDGTSCVEQMIRLQWDRAEKAERELAALRVVGGGASPEGPWEIITNEDGDVRIQRQPIANGKRPSVLLPLTWGPRDPEAIAVRDALNRVASRSPQP